MCLKLPLGDLNPCPYPPHPINTYTCEVTIASRACGGRMKNILSSKTKCIVKGIISVHSMLKKYK